MFGISDTSIIIAYLLTVGGAALCVVYGVLNWNKGDNSENVGEKK